MLVCDQICKIIEELGNTYIFGYPGGAAIPLFDALPRSNLKLILTRSESGATFMADGYARCAQKPGIVFVTSGPGVTNAITGIYNAFMDSIPLVIISGQVNTHLLGTQAFQEVDILSMVKSITKYSTQIRSKNEVESALVQAITLATSGRKGPVLIDIPSNILKQPWQKTETNYQPLPDKKDIYPAHNNYALFAKLIKNSKRPVILAGHGATHAKQQLIQFSNTIGAPVCTTLLGKAAIPEHFQHSMGMVGMHGPEHANLVMLEADLIISIGSRWDDRITNNDRRFCPQAKKLHIDIDPNEINRVVKVDGYLIGDAKIILEKLNHLLHRKPAGQWLIRASSLKMSTNKKESANNKNTISMSSAIKGLAKIAGDNTIYTTDVGQHQMWAAQHLELSDPSHWITSAGAGTMGYGFPAAIGAKLARPNTPVYAIVGDGGFQMTMCELSTAIEYKINIKIVILDNECLGLVRQWQEMFYQENYSGIALNNNPIFSKIDHIYPGLKCFAIDHQDELQSVITQASHYNKPCIIHIKTIKDSNVYPIIPPGNKLNEMILSKA